MVTITGTVTDAVGASALWSATATQGTSAIWQASAPSGGGYVRNMDIHADGTMVAAGDVFPLYLGSTVSGAKWQPVMFPGNFPPGILGFNGGTYTNGATADGSVWSVAIAPTNSNVIYIFYSGQVFVTINKGVSWTQASTLSVAYSQGLSNDNNSWCQLQHKIAVDPNNANCVVVGTPANGFFVTTNGGSTWTQPAGTPTSSSQPGVTGIVFDPTSGTTGGLTNTVYAVVLGSGVWRTTTTVNGTWSLISSAITLACGACCIGGVYYCAGGTAVPSTTLSAYSGGAWSTIVTDSNGIRSLAANPNNANNIAYVSHNGGLPCQVNISAKSLLSYTNSATCLAGDCPDLQYMPANGNWYSVGQCMWDPLVSQRLWFCCGIGVFYTDSITSASLADQTRLTYVPHTSGIAAMVGSGVISPPGGDIIASFMDRQTWQIASPSAEPSVPYGVAAYRSNIYASFDLDWASANPSTIICSTIQGQSSGASHCGISADGGNTWTEFASQPWGSGYPVNLAASSATNWCVLKRASGGVGPVYYTTNGGAAWTAATGLPSGGLAPGTNGAVVRGICADRVTAGTFYAASSGNGLYASTNNGAAWTKQGSLPTTLSWWMDKLLSVPGNAGHLFLCVVNASIGGAGHPASTLSYRSTNGGVSWTALANIKDVWCIGFGQPAPGYTYPTVWLIGWVSVNSAPYKWGVWVSKDNCITWTWLIDYPGGNWQFPTCITGGSNDYTQCYVSYGGGNNGTSVYYGSGLSF